MDNSTLENTTAILEEPSFYCPEPDWDYILQRVILNVFFGTILSVICIIFNSFVFAVFVTNPQHRNSPNLYMLLLAVFDVFLGVGFVALFSVRVFYHWIGSLTLKYIWAQYLVVMLAVAQVAMTASTYLITFAAIERYCASVDSWAVAHLQRHRPIFAFIAVMCGVISKGTFLFEIQTVRIEECIDTFGEYQIRPHYLLTLEWFRFYFRFIFRNVFTILAPFVILLYLNVRLVYRLRKQRQIARTIQHTEEKQSVKQKKARIIAVTKTLVIIVCTYLMSNFLQVIITLWEFYDQEGLMANHPAFYTLSVDWISVFTILASCLRLPIYLIFQPVLRAEMKSFIAQLWTNEKLSRRMTIIENLHLSLPQTMLVNQQDSTTDHIEFV